MKIHESLQYGRRFRDIFHTDLRPLLDDQMLLLGEAVIDTFKLDDWLCKEWFMRGYDEKESIKDNIERLYGKEAVELVMKFL